MIVTLDTSVVTIFPHDAATTIVRAADGDPFHTWALYREPGGTNFACRRQTDKVRPLTEMIALAVESIMDAKAPKSRPVPATQNQIGSVCP